MREKSRNDRKSSNIKGIRPTAIVQLIIAHFLTVYYVENVLF